MNGYLVEDIVYFCKRLRSKARRLGYERLKYYDLTIVLQGELSYVADGNRYTLKKDDVMLLPPGTVRRRDALPVITSYVSFNFTLLPEVSLPFLGVTSNAATAEIKKFLSLIPQGAFLAHYSAKPTHINLLNCILLELFDVYAINQATLIKSSNDHVYNAIRYIERNLTRKITLNDISNEVGLTKEYTAYIFKRETGRTVTQYVNERKMQLAHELIKNSDMSLAEISFHLGFESYNYFSRLLKQHFDLPPGKLKKNERQK